VVTLCDEDSILFLCIFGYKIDLMVVSYLIMQLKTQSVLETLNSAIERSKFSKNFKLFLDTEKYYFIFSDLCISCMLGITSFEFFYYVSSKIQLIYWDFSLLVVSSFMEYWNLQRVFEARVHLVKLERYNTSL
jgi:hypothetical protein